MKKIIFVVLIAGFIAPAGLMAQKVSVVGGKVILDLTGMPAGSRDYASKGLSPSSDAANEKMYQKLEVATSDTGSIMPWASANTACPAGWRLPTQRELMLMYIMKSAIEALTTSLGATGYWSATGGPGSPWCVIFNDPNTSAIPIIGTTYKPEMLMNPSYGVRCVREVAP